ncbi:MAG TPA: prolyl oligopeptidase family serine peptidase [Verrucomicrobiae bacterium]|jgi:prolyl oligopeptidase|nr:prolyl oligopeptidase family serine peptidase [Verrucomicrobiae bacterium]
MHSMLLVLLTAIALPAIGQAQTPDSADPYIWLEEVSSPRSMAWVERQNETTTNRLEADPRYARNYAEALEIAGAKDRIPEPEFVHGEIYNFWQDPEHLRGIWRKTTLEDYTSAQPHWTTVLDIDALNKAEGKSWVFKGATLLKPDDTRCMIELSDGGEDAVVAREFDLDASKFVDGGFTLPRGKHRIAWEDKDTLLIATDWAPGDLTTSGYPYIVKRLKRGQPLSAAVEVFRGTKDDGGYGIGPAVLHDGQGHSLTLINRSLDTFRSEHYVLTERGTERLSVPAKADVADLVQGRVILQLDEAWTVAGKTFEPGSVVQTELAATKASPGALRPALIWAPGSREALNGLSSTRDKLLLGVLDNVQGKAFVYTPSGEGWTRESLDLPKNVSINFGSADAKSNRAFINVSRFLSPSALWLADADTGALHTVKTLPPKFDASHEVVEQFAATSSDGTRIPYFVVHRKGATFDGSTPTLMTAYGGFQIAMTPHYSGAMGKLWLEQGGAFVLANIRGGGEFGPKWHEAGLGVKRQIIYDDFAAVAKDLFARKITSPRRLGIEGGSNGGLLMGVELTEHSELWRAVVIQVPLLDMIRISKIAAGASWQGEYGDVNADPAVKAFWLKTSPYQNLRPGVAYPEPFIFTTTKDDRVGPQHARKFAARMEQMGLPFLYYENTEGGHGAGADLKQGARTTALTMTYLQEKLMN